MQASLNQKQRLQQLFYPKASRSTEIDLIEAPQPRRFSSTWHPARVLRTFGDPNVRQLEPDCGLAAPPGRASGRCVKPRDDRADIP